MVAVTLKKNKVAGEQQDQEHLAYSWPGQIVLTGLIHKILLLLGKRQSLLQSFDASHTAALFAGCNSECCGDFELPPLVIIPGEGDGGQVLPEVNGAVFWVGQARSSHTCWKGLDPPEAGALLGDKSSKAIQVASVGWAGAGEGAEAA